MTGFKSRVWKCALVWVGIGIVALPGVAAAASVSGVINKYIEATGGLEAQEAITSAIRKGELNVVEYGLNAEITMFHKNGNFRTEMNIPDFGEVVSGVTGDVVWSMDPMQGSRILEGAEAHAILEQASLNPLLKWRDLYSDAEVVGEEDGMTKIKLTSESGGTTTMYFDQETDLLSRIDGSGAAGDTTIRFLEYKKVGDVLIAHMLVAESPQAIAEVTTDILLLNVDIDDKTFELPPEILALLPENPAKDVALAPEPAPAAEGDDFSAEQIMTFMDSNGDGKISYDEASPGEFRNNFAFVDTDGDGFANLAELTVAMAFSKGGETAPTKPAPAAEGDDFSAEQIMAFMDTNGDGKISLDEASPGEFKDNFAFVDSDGDGFADLAELKVAMAFSDSGQASTPEPAPADEFTAEQLMSFMDSNGDGKITMDEAPDDVKQGFSFIDTNGDGGIDVKEAQIMVDFSKNQ